jgi:glycine cleavage system H protein
VFVDLPDVGTEVTAGGSFGEVESTKSVSDLFAPMSGEVIEVNAELVESPQRLNDDPYGEGWICVVKVSDPTELDRLLDAEAYQSLIED